MKDADFTVRFSTIGDEVREAIKRVHSEQATVAAEEQARVEASVRPHLETLVDRVEAAIRARETEALVLELKGEHALRSSSTGRWEKEPPPGNREYMLITEELVRTALSPGAALACKTLRKQKLNVTVYGPKEHPRLMVSVIMPT